MPFYLFFLLIACARSSRLDDQELALRIKNGDHQAFKLFFDDIYPMLLGYVVRMGLAKEDARDIVQQSFIKIWEKRAGIDENKSLRAFLFKMAYNSMLNTFRDSEKFEKAEPDSFNTGQSPEELVSASITKEALEKAIATLPEKRRQTFELCFIQQFTYKETAEALGVSVKTVENQMSSALKSIREKMKGYL